MRALLFSMAVPHLLLLLYWPIGGQLTDLPSSSVAWAPGGIILLVWLLFLARLKLFGEWPQATRVHDPP